MNKSPPRKPQKSYYNPERSAWSGARDRCTKTHHSRYADYGGRGITMCDRWLSSFDNFKADMGPRPSKKHSLDRIDNEKGYSPENCRWATLEEQAANKRYRKDAHMVTINGITKPATSWAREYGLDGGTIIYRKDKLGLTDMALVAAPDSQKQTRGPKRWT